LFDDWESAGDSGASAGSGDEGSMAIGYRQSTASLDLSPVPRSLSLDQEIAIKSALYEPKVPDQPSNESSSEEGDYIDIEIS
jgi:hypothetical protein